MDINVSKVIARNWNKEKPIVLVFGLGTPKLKGARAVRAKEVAGKSGADIARIVGMGQIGADQHLRIAQLKLPIKEGDVGKPGKSQGVYVFPVIKGTSLTMRGYLRADEKFNIKLIRRNKTDPVIWRVDGKANPLTDPKLIDLIAKQRSIDHWSKQCKTIARVLPADRPDSQAGTGYFTLSRAIVGKSPKEMERALGFKTGSLANGANVFVAQTNKLDPAKVEFRGYTHLPGGNPTDFKGMTREEIETELKTMKFPPGDGHVQFVVTSRIAVKKVTARAPLKYDEKLRL